MIGNEFSTKKSCIILTEFCANNLMSLSILNVYRIDTRHLRTAFGYEIACNNSIL